MIGLVNLLPPPGDGVGTECMAFLPPPPAPRYAGFAVRCRSAEEARATVTWYRSVLESRPATPLGMVASESDAARGIADLDHSLTFLLPPDELVAGALPKTVLEELRAASVEGRVYEEVVAEHGDRVVAEEETVKAVIAKAVSGGTLQSAGREIGLSGDTVARRLQAVGISAGSLKREVRLRAYELRVELGMEPTCALAAGGWSDQDQRRKFAARLRKD